MKSSAQFLTATALICGGWIAFAALMPKSASASVREPVVHLPYDSAVIDRQIAGGERAVKADPGGALQHSLLSAAYLARSRESDDLAAAQKAEASARLSLELRKEGNQGAWNKLISSLLQQHRFKDALAQCRQAIAARVADDQTFRNLTDCLIEVGAYDEAAKLISTQTRAFSDASGWTIEARLLDIQGKPEQALMKLKAAAEQADDSFGMPSDAVAWFHVRLATQFAKMGRHAEGADHFEKALELYPRDYKAMAGLARVAFQERNWNDVVKWGKRSDEIAQMADIRALVGDAYAMLGDHTEAEAQYNLVATLIGRPSGQTDGLHEVAPMAGAHGHRLDRQYAMYCADHERDLDGAYAAAIRDFDAREDIYAFDTLAWVCRKQGRKAEALAAIEQALATNTLDPVVRYHAGIIYFANGKLDAAKEHLELAFKADPSFDPVGAAEANSTLEQIAARGKN